MLALRTTLLLVLLACAAPAVLPAPIDGTRRYTVKLHAAVADPAAAARALAERYGLELRHTYTQSFRGFAASVPARRLGALRSDPLVEAVEPVTRGELAGASFAASPARAQAAPRSVPAGIRRVGADHSPLAAIDGLDGPLDVDVAVIDSGVEPNHPDLHVAGSVVCNGGFADETRAATDLSGHGTAVAGIIAARDNNIGVVGVAPGARLWSIRVASRGPDGRVSYASDDLLCAVEWITAHADAIEVANISLGAYDRLGGDRGPCGGASSSVSATLHRAICAAVEAGVTVVVAAGEPRPSMPRTAAALLVPASFDEVITVAAMVDLDGRPGGLARRSACAGGDADDTMWDASNYGTDVDLVAPGECITTTSPYLWSGTSFAAPHVTGAAALLKAVYPEATPAEVKRALLAAAETGWNISAGPLRPAGDDPDGIPDPLLDVSRLPPPGASLDTPGRPAANSSDTTAAGRLQ